MPSWNKIAETRMRKAEHEGQLKGLSGEGKPLPHRPEEALVDIGEAVGARIMAEAGVLPREVALKKRMDALLEQLATQTDPTRRKALMTELADIQMRHGMETEARRKFLRG